MGDFNTYWQMTINNYDERDLALVRQGYPDDIRKLVYTLEKGEQGTPHIQAYIHMKRSVRLSHMKKLFPGAHFASQTSAEWRLNQHNYAQKLDPTAESPAVIQNNDPLHTIEGTIRRVMRWIEKEMAYHEYSYKHLMEYRKMAEKRMVQEDYTMAKVFVSAVYKQMWKQYGEDMYSNLAPVFARERLEEVASRENIADTHTHTHEDEKISHEGGITTNASEDGSLEDGSSHSGSEESGEDDEGHDDSEGSESKASDESDDSGCSESDVESED